MDRTIRVRKIQQGREKNIDEKALQLKALAFLSTAKKEIFEKAASFPIRYGNITKLSSFIALSI
jgi:hypothetical protein